MRIARVSKYYYLRLKRLRGSPQSLASGFAIGIFIGLTPTIPFHTIAIIFITLITRTSTVAGIISGWIICNPFTYIPIVTTRPLKKYTKSKIIVDRFLSDIFSKSSMSL